MRSNLQTKLVAAMFFLCALSAVTATSLTAILWLRGQRESVDEQLQASAAVLLSLGISDFTELEDFQQMDQFIEDSLQMERMNRIIRVFDSAGNPLFSSVQFPEKTPDFPASPASKALLGTVHAKSGQFRSLVMPYRAKNERGVYYLQVLMSLPRAKDILKNLWWEGLVLFFLLSVVALLLSKLLAKRLLQPVEGIGQFLEGMDPKDIEQWKPLRITREGDYLSAISEGINRLIERTRASVRQIHKMSRFVAHEMRTPLTILQGEAENILANPGAGKSEYEKVLKSSLEEIQRMSEIVTTVLAVGQASPENAAGHATEIELSQWIQVNRKHWEDILGTPLGWRTEEGAERLRVLADPRLLYRLLDNLIRNVRIHTPRGSHCRICLATEEGQAVLAIIDDGPGMSEASRRSLNQDGRLSDYAGVGLNLCLTIAQNCGWELRFLPVEPHGLKVTIAFPK